MHLTELGMILNKHKLPNSFRVTKGVREMGLFTSENL